MANGIGIHRKGSAAGLLMRGTAALLCALMTSAVLLAAPAPLTLPAARPSATASSAPNPKAASTPAVKQVSDQDVISFLGQAITWYRHLQIEESLANEPAETLFLADDRQMAREVTKLAFDYAHAWAAAFGNVLVATSASSAEQAAGVPRTALEATAGIVDLSTHLTQAQSDLVAARTQANALAAELAHAPAAKRKQLQAQLAAARAALVLDQSRVDSMKAMQDFERARAGGGKKTGLLARIDELERSVPELAQGAAPAQVRGVVQPQLTPPRFGILGLTEELIALSRKDQALDDTVQLTRRLADTVARLRPPLIAELQAINSQSVALVNQAAGARDLPTIELHQSEFKALITRHKLIVAALIPLDKASMTLSLYTANLNRWLAEVDRREHETLTSLIARLAALGTLLLVIFGAAEVWRRVTFRYVQDVRHRDRILQFRRITLVAVLALVIMFNFANQIGAIATVLGFAAAGIAFALQNVILSVAGYFFLSGRFGIKAGDRVQIGCVSGDVIDVGLVKLSLMELSGDGNDRQPTGRVVVFPNSIVFQSNFSKQAPGTTFVWNELSLTLAPDCDYQLAEQRLRRAVDEVFERYATVVRHEYREMEKHLNLWLEPPAPQSRVLLSENGVRILLRFPVQARSVMQTTDEICRRLLEVVNEEPRLKLAAPGTPVIQRAEPPAEANAAPEPAKNTGALAEQPADPAPPASRGAPAVRQRLR